MYFETEVDLDYKLHFIKLKFNQNLHSIMPYNLIKKVCYFSKIIASTI